MVPSLENIHQYLLPLFPEIAEELTRMRDIDQEARLRKNPDGAEIKRIDETNTARLKEIIAQIGWPNTTKVGDLSSKNAWLLAQHADHDRAFQEYCLDLMNQEPEGEVRKRDIAYLTDRVLVAKEAPQRYGTQFYQSLDDQGNVLKCHLRDVEEPETLEQRRASMDLEPIREYVQDFAERCGFIAEEIDLGNLEPYVK